MKRLFIVLMLSICIVILTGCQKASNYSEEEHIQRVSELVEKRYFKDNHNYTGYKIYPVYNDNEDLAFFLIELEPMDYVYVRINEKDMSFLLGTSMYTRREGKSWRRYTVKEESKDTVEEDEKLWETDENGNFIYYKYSHFKAANIENENRYLLKITQGGRTGYIPAVKRGEQYFNLISMQEFTYEPVIEDEIHAVSDITFIAKNSFDL